VLTDPETALNVRPDRLPDFSKPPLNEVVLGVQFSPPKGYQQIRAGEVWSLFKTDYPLVQEQTAIEPMFETFGLPHQGQIGGRLSFIAGPMHDRFWFVKNTQDELIQFQSDRLLHNWRKVGDRTNEYPRFEGMAQRFTAELRMLEAYAAKLAPQTLAINQCEVSYINHIDVGSGPLKVQDWLRGMVPAGVAFEDVSGACREVIHGETGKPIGRITYEIGTAIKPDGARMLVLNLTARGAPDGNDIDSALRFIAKGRELIVTRFANITTDAAHQAWGRQQ
jgi:uncharacterized protein (TIGR04255 family)